jgi:hypothetical protein
MKAPQGVADGPRIPKRGDEREPSIIDFKIRECAVRRLDHKASRPKSALLGDLGKKTLHVRMAFLPVIRRIPDGIRLNVLRNLKIKNFS